MRNVARPFYLVRRAPAYLAALCVGSPIAFVPAFTGEFVQHGAEWRLGMLNAGHSVASARERTIWLIFGALKAACFIATAVLAKRALSSRMIKPDDNDHRSSGASAAALIVILAPLYWCHYHLVASAVGARPMSTMALVTMDAATVSLMAALVGVSMFSRGVRHRDQAHTG